VTVVVNGTSTTVVVPPGIIAGQMFSIQVPATSTVNPAAGGASVGFTVGGTGTTPPAAATVPPGWEYSESSQYAGRFFYRHIKSGQVQWQLPTLAEQQAADAGVAPQPAARQHKPGQPLGDSLL
jgi:hypothetical protein